MGGWVGVNRYKILPNAFSKSIKIIIFTFNLLIFEIELVYLKML